MVIEKLRGKFSVNDEDFDMLFPEDVREYSNRHYTSVFLAQKAAEFLVRDENDKILDIGSGTGKFCIVGALTTHGHFTGVEYRKYQSEIARNVAQNNSISNVAFIHANILDVPFDEFTGFYMFNPFLEQIDRTAKMDGLIKDNAENYVIFNEYVQSELIKKNIGTRLATYYVPKKLIPDSYKLVASHFGDVLCFYQKVG
jgi:SAM-dependent methyltransferase